MAADQTELPTQFCRLRIYFLFDAFQFQCSYLCFVIISPSFTFGIFTFLSCFPVKKINKKLNKNNI